MSLTFSQQSMVGFGPSASNSSTTSSGSSFAKMTCKGRDIPAARLSRKHLDSAKTHHLHHLARLVRFGAYRLFQLSSEIGICQRGGALSRV